MYQQFYNQASWVESNDYVAQKFSMDGRSIKPQCYLGPHGGLMEILSGLARQFIIKKKLFVVQDANPFFHSVINYFAGEAYDVKLLSLEQAQQGGDWLDEIDNTCLAVLLPMDTPFLPLLNDFSETEEKLKERKAYFLKCFHNYYYSHPLPSELWPFEIQLINLNCDFSLGLMGARANFSTYFSSGLNWPAETVENHLSYINSLKEDNLKVLEFEKNKGHGFLPAISHESRSFDRAVVFNEQVDATALIDSLAAKFGDKQLETPSLSRWGGLRTMDWLKNCGYSFEKIRGMLVVDQEIISPEFVQALQDAREEIVSLQRG